MADTSALQNLIDAGSIGRTLKSGTTAKPAVQALQEILHALGFGKALNWDRFGPDGDYGKSTAKAVAAFANGCVIKSPSLSGLKPTKVSTVAGMAQIAMERELYFNLHTTGQTFYGDIRGQLYASEN